MTSTTVSKARISRPMLGRPRAGSHFRVECRHCGTVIRQCKCPGPKTVLYETCRECGEK